MIPERADAPAGGTRSRRIVDGRNAEEDVEEDEVEDEGLWMTDGPALSSC